MLYTRGRMAEHSPPVCGTNPGRINLETYKRHSWHYLTGSSSCVCSHLNYFKTLSSMKLYSISKLNEEYEPEPTTSLLKINEGFTSKYVHPTVHDRDTQHKSMRGYGADCLANFLQMVWLSRISRHGQHQIIIREHGIVTVSAQFISYMT